MSFKEKNFVLCLIKALWLMCILFGFIALRLEIDVFMGNLLREQVDATYMLESLAITVVILCASSTACLIRF